MVKRIFFFFKTKKSHTQVEHLPNPDRLDKAWMTMMDVSPYQTSL